MILSEPFAIPSSWIVVGDMAKTKGSNQFTISLRDIPPECIDSALTILLNRFQVTSVVIRKHRGDSGR